MRDRWIWISNYLLFGFLACSVIPKLHGCHFNDAFKEKKNKNQVKENVEIYHSDWISVRKIKVERENTKKRTSHFPQEFLSNALIFKVVFCL